MQKRQARPGTRVRVSEGSGPGSNRTAVICTEAERRTYMRTVEHSDPYTYGLLVEHGPRSANAWMVVRLDPISRDPEAIDCFPVGRLTRLG